MDTLHSLYVYMISITGAIILTALFLRANGANREVNVEMAKISTLLVLISIVVGVVYLVVLISNS